MTTVLRSLIAASLAFALVAPLARAGGKQGDMELLSDAIHVNGDALVSANLNLTPAEAEKFWPVYQAYQKEMNAVRDRMSALIDDYKASFTTMSDEKALEIADTYLQLEKDRAKVRRDHLDAIAEALPGKKVARFYQIENKMDAIVRYELAATIPVVEE